MYFYGPISNNTFSTYIFCSRSLTRIILRSHIIAVVQRSANVIIAVKYPTQLNATLPHD